VRSLSAEQTSIIINQVSVFGILMAIGFLFSSFKVVAKEALGGISSVLINIILPSLVFSTIASSGATGPQIIKALPFIAFCVGTVMVLMLCGYLMAKLFRIKGSTANVFAMLNMFGNYGFLGIPLILAIIDTAEAKLYLTLYAFVEQSLIWTVGVYLCSRHQKDVSIGGNLKRILNPTTAALILSLIFVFLNIKTPNVILTALTGLGGTSKYISLIYIGGTLASTSAAGILKKPYILAIPAVKMIAAPLAVYTVGRMLFSQTAALVLALIVAMPSMAITAIIAKNYGADDSVAVEAIFLTTILSLFTIPLVSYLISLV